MSSILVELSIIILVTVFVAGVLRLLKQPLIISYIISGVLLGPYALNVVKSEDAIATFASIGVALLLFVVGLYLNPRVIKEVGVVSVITGGGQVAATFVVGFGLAWLFDFTLVESLYIAMAITFSSTIVIMKLLTDKGLIDTLFARLTIGFLIVQDLIAVAILIIISSFSGAGSIGTLFFGLIFKGLMVGLVMLLIGVYIFPKITKSIVRSQEYLLLFAIGWCLSMATIFELIGFSFEVGALLAGIMLSLSPYHSEVALKMRPLRDFFIVMFFILLGSRMVFTDFTAFLIPALVFSLFILIGNPIIFMVILSALGFTKRTAFSCSMSAAQISEFSMILIALGVSLGHLDQEILAFVTLIGLITIGGSTYFIIYMDQLYHKLSGFLSIFERNNRRPEHSGLDKEDYDIILFGCNRIGFSLLEAFGKLKRKFLIIDNNPDVVDNLKGEGYHVRYSDAGNTELLGDINFRKTRMVVSTVPDIDVNITIINKIHLVNKDCIIIVLSHQVDEALQLYEAGASYVIMPHFLGGHSTSTMIEEHGLNLERFLEKK